MRLRNSAATITLVLATTASAMAQTPVPMTMGTTDLSGFYLGANLGGGFTDSTVTNNNNGNTSNPQLNGGGWLGGVQGGYNWRLSPKLLLGVEADFDGTGLSNSNGQQAVNFPNGVSFSGGVSRREEWLGTVRGRIGYNFISPDWLSYITGGFAYGQVDSSAFGTVSGVTVPGVAGPQSYSFAGSKSGVQTGWTVGSGQEIALSPQFSLVLQYLYTDLGSFTYNPAVRNATAAALVTSAKNNLSVDNNSHLFRIGLNYHFGVPTPPPPAPLAMPAPPPAAPKVFIVFFDWDKDVITPEGEQIIQQAADAYKSGAPVQLQVTGYTDRSGSPGYNQRLSERRANNVAKAMAALGVPQNQMVVSGRGENDNRVPTAPGVREPQNRRVEIVES